MRVWHIGANGVVAMDTLPQVLPDAGFLWISTTRPEFERGIADIQSALQH